uniref:Uncharacterized protein n=1 Tax=Plectus sambesii TaxID=2011161 RepID=A0A914VYE2_9BILA
MSSEEAPSKPGSSIELVDTKNDASNQEQSVSGLGFIVGSNVADWLGHWQWGLRVTPIFGIICLILIVFVLHEPKRGEAEQAQVIPTSYWQDIKYLIFNRTYVYSTLGYTFVVFVAGAMTWWTPTAVEHAWAVTNHKEEASKDVKANISLVFGVITCLGGFFGVTLGSMVAQMWRDGKSCFKSVQNPRADPYVCAIGSFVAAPMLFASIQLFAKNSYLADFFVFLAVLNLCLNWAVVVDISMYVFIPSRRSTASAFQILFCHLFGDAASPYIIGLVSDGLRGSDTSALGHYNSLQRAFYIPNVVLIISGAFFLLSAFYVESDQRKATDEMHSNATCDISATEQSGSLTTSSINSTQ